MTHRLIFVCEANVCRSPLMERVLRAQGSTADWQITSAGTRVGPGGLEICSISAGVASDAGSSDAEHHSTPIDADELRNADMILTASRAERSAVAALVPDARSRTFTLREAIHLGTEPVQPEEFALMAEFASSAAAARGLELYAEALHSRRGFVALPTPRRTLRGRRSGNPYDIPDAHHRSERAHRAMLASTASDIVKFHRQATGFLEAPTTAEMRAPEATLLDGSESSTLAPAVKKKAKAR